MVLRQAHPRRAPSRPARVERAQPLPHQRDPEHRRARQRRRRQTCHPDPSRRRSRSPHDERDRGRDRPGHGRRARARPLRGTAPGGSGRPPLGRLHRSIVLEHESGEAARLPGGRRLPGSGGETAGSCSAEVAARAGTAFVPYLLNLFDYPAEDAWLARAGSLERAGRSPAAPGRSYRRQRSLWPHSGTMITGALAPRLSRMCCTNASPRWRRVAPWAMARGESSKPPKGRVSTYSSGGRSRHDEPGSGAGRRRTSPQCNRPSGPRARMAIGRNRGALAASNGPNMEAGMGRLVLPRSRPPPRASLCRLRGTRRVERPARRSWSGLKRRRNAPQRPVRQRRGSPWRSGRRTARPQNGRRRRSP